MKKTTIRIDGSWDNSAQGCVSDAWWAAASDAPVPNGRIGAVLESLHSVDEATVPGDVAREFLAWAAQFPGFEAAFGK